MRVLVLMLFLAATGVARADDHCDAPLADWQPREALIAKLEADGWRDIAVRVHDGCYLVHADNAQGERLHGLFDPATLAFVRRRERGGRHHGQDD